MLPVDKQSRNFASREEAVKDRILEVNNLSFRYTPEPQLVLSSVTFGLTRGSLTAIVGRSGCGKSTLLNILAGFLEPTTGVCTFRGHPVVGPEPSRIPIFQEDALWPWWTALENVLLQNRLSGVDKAAATKHAADLLQRVGVPKPAHSQYPKQLSLGMRRRVEIARALFAQPQLLLADEPFSSVDIHTREALHQFILNVWEQKQLTALFATHDLHEALFLATEIAIMSPTLPSTVLKYLVWLPMGREAPSSFLGHISRCGCWSR